MSRPLDVLIVCEDLRTGLRLRAKLRATLRTRVRILTANASDRPKRCFYAAFARGCVTRPLAVTRLLMGRLLLLSHRTLDDPSLISRVSADIGVHAAGAIYRRPFLDRFGMGLLNAHIGLLPRYRGRSVMEWSILHGDETGITVFLVDEHIDTGPIVHRRVVPIPEHLTDVASAKSYLFSLDGELYREALERLSTKGLEAVSQEPSAGVRFYRMSGLLTQHVSEILADREASRVRDEPSIGQSPG